MKNWIRGTNAAVFSLALIGVFIVATLLLSQLDELKWDLTGNQQFTLSEQTKSTLAKLKQPIKVRAFLYGVDSYDKPIKDMLSMYKRQSDRVSLETLILDKNPIEARKYDLQIPAIVFEYDKRTETVSYEDLFSPQSPQPDNSEQKFTQAILNLLAENKKTIYMLSGHDELDETRGSAFRDQLTTEGYVVESLNLLQKAKIPEDADAILVLGPLADFNDAEKKLIDAYMKGDGKLLLTLDYASGMESHKNINALMKSYGITNEETIVLQLADNIFNDPFIIVPYFDQHPLTEKLIPGGKSAVMPSSISLSSKDNKTDWVLKPLLKTSEFAFAKKDRKFLGQEGISLDQVQQTKGDLPGPLDLAYAVENTEGKSKMVVVGSTMFLTNNSFDKYANRDFAMNSVAWLTENENLVTIRPVDQSTQTAPLPIPQMLLITVGILVVLPLAFLVVGIVFWWRRRKA